MARTKGRISARVEAVFRDHPDKLITIGTLVAKTMCNATQISSAITYLRTKYRQTDGAAGLPIETIERAHKWVYREMSLGEDAGSNGEEVIPSSRRTVNRTALRRMANKLSAEVQAPDWGQAERAEAPTLDARKILSGTLTPPAPLHVQTQFAPVAASGPAKDAVLTVKVLGTLQETGEVLVHGDGDNFTSGIWVMRRLV